MKTVTFEKRPMLCPMSFNNVNHNGPIADLKCAIECTPDCAWAKTSLDGRNYSCAIAQLDGGGVYNYRSFKDKL